MLVVPASPDNNPHPAVKPPPEQIKLVEIWYGDALNTDTLVQIGLPLGTANENVDAAEYPAVGLVLITTGSEWFVIALVVESA